MSAKSFILKFIAVAFILTVMLGAAAFFGLSIFTVEVNESSDIDTQTARQVHPPLELVGCVDDVEQADDPNLRDILARSFTREFPDLQLKRIGSYCLLNNQNKLVTYGYNEDNRLQNMAFYYDSDFEIIEYTNDFECGDLGRDSFPVIQSIEENVVTLTCSLDNSNEIYTETYHLYLPDLAVELDKIETEPVY